MLLRLAGVAVIVLGLTSLGLTQPNSQLIDEDQASAFAGEVVKQLKLNNKNHLPGAVTLEVVIPKFPRRPVAFAERALRDALVHQGIKEVRDGQDFIVRVSLEEKQVLLASASKKETAVPYYDLNGEVRGPGFKGVFIEDSLKPLLLKRPPPPPPAGEVKVVRVTRTPEQDRGIRERISPDNSDYLEEERALLQGIHVDCTLAGSVGGGGPPLHKLLSDRQDMPTTYLEGSKVFAARSSPYAVEVYPGELVRDGQAVRVQVKEPAFQPTEDSRHFARIDVKPGTMIVLRLYNLDRGYEASARVMLDTLDSFAFSSEKARHNGGQRWLLDKEGWGDVDGWDYRDGKALTFVLGAEGEINVGSAEENERLRKILSDQERAQLQRIAGKGF
jgi:hypothetical protein